MCLDMEYDLAQFILRPTAENRLQASRGTAANADNRFRAAVLPAGIFVTA